MSNEFDITNEPRPSRPQKLRWYQFSLRSLFVVMTLLALGLGLYIKYVKQDEERRARIEYLRSCLNYDPEKDLSKNLAKFDSIGSRGIKCGGDGVVDRGQGEMILIFRNATKDVPAECLKTFMEIYRQQNPFGEPQTVEISENAASLNSPEGWLRMEAKWLTENWEHRKNYPALEIKWEYFFKPIHPPSEKQKLP
jgi:hypothetical protein